MGFLLAVPVLLTLGGIGAFLPLIQCPLDPYLVYTDLPCPRCDGRGRITFLNRMRHGPQAAPPWEGMKIGWIEGSGFTRTNFRAALDLADIFGGVPTDNQKRIAAAETLLGTGQYDKVTVVMGKSPHVPGRASVTISVIERAP
jgi:hypothetical protein